MVLLLCNSLFLIENGKLSEKKFFLVMAMVLQAEAGREEKGLDSDW